MERLAWVRRRRGARPANGRPIFLGVKESPEKLQPDAWLSEAAGTPELEADADALPRATPRPGVLCLLVKHHSGDIARVRVRTTRIVERLMTAAASALALGPLEVLCFASRGRRLKPQKTAKQSRLQDGHQIDVMTRAECKGCCANTLSGHGKLMGPGRGKRRSAETSAWTWERFRAARMPEVMAELEDRWAKLAADPQALELVAWRQRAQTEGAAEELRRELDSMIARRSRTDVQEVPAPSPKRRRCEEPSWAAAALVSKLGLDVPGMPGPLQAFLEIETMGASGQLRDEEASSLLERFIGLSPLRRRALWSMVGHRAHLQDLAIAAALSSRPKTALGGFGRFLEACRTDSRRVSDVGQPRWVVAMQKDFLWLPEEELSLWLQEPLPWQP